MKGWKSAKFVRGYTGSISHSCAHTFPWTSTRLYWLLAVAVFPFVLGGTLSVSADELAPEFPLDGYGTESIEYGLAMNYPGDGGIVDHPAVIFASGFESAGWLQEDFGYSGYTSSRGYRVTDPEKAYAGQGILEYQNKEGKHVPFMYDVPFEDQDVIFLRWYRKYEAGYDYSCQSKTNGVYAVNPNGCSGAGVPPTGYDKFSTKLQVWPVRGSDGFHPKFYSYHPEQPGPYGESLPQNVGQVWTLESGRWYCFEIMLKANEAGQRDGEIKLWIDGVLKGHYTGMRFRDTNALKINELNIGAYMGGHRTAPKDQKLWDDNLVLATVYIGPMRDTIFADVPISHPYHDEIEALYQAGYTAGCSTDPLMYCPDDIMIRAESAVFVERGIHGVDFEPDVPAVSSFVDMPSGYWGEGWIEGLWADGYTAGCGTDPLSYCPLAEHTRAEGCVFYLRMMHGPDYQPPEPQGIFADVPVGWWGAGWVEAAYQAGLIEPCQGEHEPRFCPQDRLTRGLAAYMMMQAKGLGH